MRKLLASYAAKYRAPLIKSFRKRRFRRLFMEGLESRRLMATIQIEPQGGSTNDAYYSIQLKDVSFVDPIIYTKDDNPEDSDNLQTLYLNSESNIVHFEGFFDQTFKGVRLQLDSQHLYAVESDGTKHPFPLKPMYFTRFDTTNSSSVTFGDFMTFGQPFFVLQEHEQLSNISNPPIVIEGPEFVQATEEDPSLSLESKNKYFKEPQIGDKKVTITGTIDTRNPSDLTQGGDIGLFSRNELKINKGSLLRTYPRT
jgi:hypothetical protein